MPSRPMLTTPARSDHRPPKPQSRIGSAGRNAVCVVFVEVSNNVKLRVLKDQIAKQYKAPEEKPAEEKKG